MPAQAPTPTPDARVQPPQPQQRPAPTRARGQARQRPTELTADQLNTMVLQRLGREPLATVPDVAEATGPAAALARARIEEKMPLAYKKGGLVNSSKGKKMPPAKPAAGVATAKTPFKFAKGGPPAPPRTTTLRQIRSSSAQRLRRLRAASRPASPRVAASKSRARRAGR